MNHRPENLVLLIALLLFSSLTLSAEVKSNRKQLVALFRNVRSPGPKMIRSISPRLDQAAAILNQKDDPELLKSLIKVYSEIAKVIGHHDFMNSFSIYYLKNSKKVNSLIDRTLSKSDAADLKERLKAVIYSEENGNG
jgi:hypothetical protein